LFAVLCAVHGARFKKRSTQKMIAGIPVHNYQAGNTKWIVMFQPGTSEEDIAKACNSKCKLTGHPSKGGVAFASLDSSEESLLKALAGQSAQIELIEADVEDQIIPDVDTMVAPQRVSWALTPIGAQTKRGTGAGVHIYIQDTGIRFTHSEFGGRAVAAIDLTDEDAGLVECTAQDKTCALDKQGHGTHCAGSAAGANVGVAHEAKLYAAQTLSDKGGGARSWQYAAIDWVAEKGARPTVLSMSLGGSGADPGYTTTLRAATRAGVVVVVAAGNSNADACNFSPAFSEYAITVGATTSANRRASYSNYGRCVDIMAPGSAIVSADVSGNTEYSSKSGTSMACPHVSGAAALLLDVDSSLTSRQIMAKLERSARTGFIGGLKPNDPDLFLWVGSGDPPAPAPTPAPLLCPSFASRQEPDADGDCKCGRGKCSVSGGSRWDCPSSAGPGGWGGRYFLPTCQNCRCYPA